MSVGQTKVQSAETASPSTPLAKGFARNSLYNLIGWAWPIFLSIVTVPYILGHLGEEAYGIYAIVSIVAGYLAMMSTPTASGNVRFLAAAYGRGDWSGLRSQLMSGILVNAAIAGAAGALLFVVAPWLAVHIFKTPAALTDVTIAAFRIAAFSYAINGVAGALRSLPVAVRRYDLVNAVTLASGTANTLFVVTALYLGYGLLGSVAAQMLSSVVALVGFGFAIFFALRGIPRVTRVTRVNEATHVVDSEGAKQLVSYSGLLFVEHVLSQVGVRIDRTLIAVMLGATAVTYYTVPSRITDVVPGITGVIVTQLYPLMAEAVASRRLGEAMQLYGKVQRLALWVVCLIGALLIANAYGLLALWINPETASKSWMVLVLLVIGVIARAPASVAFQTALGMGRAELNIVLGVGVILFPTIAGVLLIPRFGIEGAALGVAVTLTPVYLLFAGMVQWKLLGVHSLRAIGMPFLRSLGVMALAAGAAYAMPIDGATLIGLIGKSLSTVAVYIVASVLFGALSPEDYRAAYGALTRRAAGRGTRRERGDSVQDDQ